MSFFLFFLLSFYVFIYSVEDLSFHVMGLNQLVVESVSEPSQIGFLDFSTIDHNRLHLFSFTIGNNHPDGFQLSIYSENESKLILQNTLGLYENEYIDYGITLYPGSIHNGFNVFSDEVNIRLAKQTVDNNIVLEDYYDVSGAQSSVSPFPLTQSSNSVSASDFVFDFVDTTHATNNLKFDVFFSLKKNFYLNKGLYFDTINLFLKDI